MEGIDAPGSIGGYLHCLDLPHPDGKSYAYTHRRVLSDLYLVENAR